MFSFFNHRGFQRGKLALATFCSAAALTGMAFSAQSADQYEPLAIQVAGEVVVPGEPAECLVQMTGGPEHITIYSNPPGVSYQGTLETATDTVNVQVAPELDADYVTLYVQSDGRQVVSTTAMVDQTATPVDREGTVEPPAGGDAAVAAL